MELRITQLIAKYRAQVILPDEEAELLRWRELSPDNERVFSELVDEEQLQKKTLIYDRPIADQHTWEQFRKRLEPSHRRVFSFSFRKMVAAVLLLLIGGAVMYYLQTSQPASRPVATTSDPSDQQQIIVPAKDRTVLTLSDGRQIFIDDTHQGIISKSNGNQVVQQDQLITYHDLGNRTPEVNTLQTRKGNTIQLLLADGSKVWLNAATKISYQTVFTGKQRVVDLEGEAYFEIAKKADQPFIVRFNGKEVEVKGTHFNVHSYRGGNDEVTLLEGAVDVRQNNEVRQLKPGQRVISDDRVGAFRLDKEPDLRQVMAWKNGIFDFQNVPIKSMLAEIERWYDIDVVYDKELVEKKFTARMTRTNSLSQLLQILEATRSIKFSVKGKQITVSKYQ